MNSGFFKLNWRDLVKTALMLVIGTVLTAVLQGLQAIPPHFPTGPELLVSLKVGGAVGLSYVIRKLLENSDGEFLKKEHNETK